MVPESIAYQLKPKARADLEKIFDDTVARWSFSQAEKYNSLLIEAFEGLADRSKIGHRFILRAGYYCYFAGSHTIIYRYLESDRLEVTRILSQRMNISRHFHH